MEETHDAPYRSTLNLKSAALSRCRHVAIALLSHCRCIDVLLHDRIVTLLCHRAVVLLCWLVLQAQDQLEICSAIALSSRCRRNVFMLLHCCVAT